MNLIGATLLVLMWLVVLALLYRREQRRRSGHGLWQDVLAGGLLWLLVFGFFWRTLSGAAYQPADGGDLVSFLFPTYRFAAAELAQGRLPLWNPTLYGGAPFIGDIQAGFLYLPNLALFLIKPDFPYTTLQGLAVGHVYWAGLGMYVLLRTLRWPVQPVSRPAAFFAAVAFAFADPLLIHFGNLNLIAVLSWLTWVLAAFVRALQSTRWIWTGVAGLLFAIGSYAGHAQSAFYIGLALLLLTVGWTATIAFEPQTPRRVWWRPAAMLGCLACRRSISRRMTAPMRAAFSIMPSSSMTRSTASAVASPTGCELYVRPPQKTFFRKWSAILSRMPIAPRGK